MELYNLRYILAIADCENLSMAAAACHVSQPTLSQQLAKVEKELGTQLFLRTARGVKPTEAGHIPPGGVPQGFLCEAKSTGGHY